MGGKTSSGYTAKCELLKLGAYSVDSSSTMELHRSIASAYYGHPDSLSMLLDVSTSVNLDSLWPALQQISATYSWDSSIIRFDGYAPPEGWVITGMAVHGNSADFTIDNISSSPTHPLDLGTAIFLPKVQSLTASNVTLQELTLQTSGGLLTPCISDNEDQHWAVKVLGLAGVETEQSSPALAIDWMRVESGTLTIGYHASDAMPSVRFELYDMLGREVQTQQSRSATTVSIDLTNLPTGSYVVRATDGASMVTKLIEIQR